MSESGNNRGDDRGNGLAARLYSSLQRQMECLKEVMRERRRYGKQRRMVLLEALQLGNRRQLFLVSCDEHRFLVGAGSDRVGTLVAFPGNPVEEVPGAVTGEARPRTGMEKANVLRGSEGRQEPAWVRPEVARTAGRLQLVQRDRISACDATAESGLGAERTQ